MDQPSIRLGETILGSHWHVCGFFHTHDDEYRLLLPFIQEGLEGGEKAVHIIDPRRRNDHIQRLRSAGIDVEAAQKSGQLDLRDWFDAHLRGGSFDKDRTLSIIGDIHQRSLQQGYSRIRFVTHMEWALEDRPGVEGLIEYEARANVAASPNPVVCVYDLTRFGGDVVVDVMRTHPVVVVGGLLQEHPVYVHPAEFIRAARVRQPRVPNRMPASAR